MFNYLNKDITTVESGIVAHGVNCQGVMGAGIALAIKKKWPRAYRDYKAYCDSTVDTKSMLGFVQFIHLENRDLIIANCFTQNFYGSGGPHAKPKAIETCLEKVASLAKGNGLSIYMPKIGCGLGGLSWTNDVKPIVEALAEKYPSVEINVVDL